MLVAKNNSGIECAAWETTKLEGPFFCPDCNEKVILKKGSIREHHFAHKIKDSCSNYVGETLIHHKCKREIYSALKKIEYCSNCNIELKVGGLRPDICLRINRKPVVIEVQRSTIDIHTIKRRTIYYSQKGIYVLWIIPDEKNLRSRFHEKHQETLVYPKSWQLFLHQMYFGRIYIWDHNAFVKSIHLERFEFFVPEGNWVEESPEEFHNTKWYDDEVGYADYGGYTKTSKTKYRAVRPTGLESNLINIAEDFSFDTRKEWSYSNFWVVPSANLWIDNTPKWW